jgi:hypothetical protein
LLNLSHLLLDAGFDAVLERLRIHQFAQELLST